MGELAAILAAWALAASTLVGIGLGLRQMGEPRPQSASDYLDAFWLGLAAALAVLQMWHLWWPINALLAGLVSLVGLIGWGRLLTRLEWGNLFGGHRRLFGRHHRPTLLAAGVLAIGAVWLGLMGLRPLEIYDAGLYHLQAISWARSYPSVPGLGNLDGRLAFDSSYFLLLAMLGQGPLAGESYRVGAGLIVLPLLAQIGLALRRVLRSPRVGADDWLLALMALPTAAFVGSNGLATTSTDLPIFVLQVVIAYQLLRWLRHLGGREGRQYLGYGLVLAAAGTTVKLSGAGLAAACVGLAVWVGLTRRRASSTVVGWPSPVAVALSVVLLAGWVITSGILSGYPFYPNAALPLSVDWRVPASQASLDTAGIVLFARQPGPLAANVYDGWGWLPDWLAANAVDLALPVTVAVLGLPLAAWQWGRNCWPQRSTLALLGPVWAALAVWFLTAPALRFAGALFWLAGAVPVATLQDRGRTRLANLSLCAFVLAALLPPQAEQLSLIVRAPVAALRRGISPVPVSAMTTFTTDSGLRLNVPADSELSWDAPLPATPRPDRRLRQRCADTLACGFSLADAP